VYRVCSEMKAGNHGTSPTRSYDLETYFDEERADGCMEQDVEYMESHGFQVVKNRVPSKI